jgi:hypothetical protein
MKTRTAPASVHRPAVELSTRIRKALSVNGYKHQEREKLEGEAPPRTISYQPWQPMADLAWQPLRAGADDAMVLQSRGDAT